MNLDWRIFKFDEPYACVRAIHKHGGVKQQFSVVQTPSCFECHCSHDGDFRTTFATLTEAMRCCEARAAMDERNPEPKQ